jgi:hypothetical protein
MAGRGVAPIGPDRHGKAGMARRGKAGLARRGAARHGGARQHKANTVDTINIMC